MTPATYLTSNRINPIPTNKKPPTQQVKFVAMWQTAIGGAPYNHTLLKFHISIG